ncbi:MAG TPA: CopG family transcriptional regulator [Thermoanaerobaculia bacterium]|nr:CopG family transcriptional regulator [Thermoanaerobaculia bacterium]
MVRKQIYIEEELERGLKALAARTGRAEAVHVRAALREYLLEHRSPEAERDPLLDLVGLVDDPEIPRDVAEEHDHYLYGAPKRGR